MNDLMDKIVALCKRRGFIYPGSEIYGGLGGTWDYGPLGVLLANNIKNEWWRNMVLHRENVVGLDSSILHHPKVWEASGHIASFTDSLIECKHCHARFRADHVLQSLSIDPIELLGWGSENQKLLKNYSCELCKTVGQFTEPRNFNLMFTTTIGAAESKGFDNTVYLRPETAQGIFINFLNVIDSTRIRIPFGIAQIGKGFRNEITTGNFLFRVREFEMMELEFFVKPQKAEESHEYWKRERLKWYLNLGLKKENVKVVDLPKEDIAHYSKGTAEIWYDWPFMGFGELEGIANRGDYDLKRHSEYSGKRLEIADPVGSEGVETPMPPYTPYVIEPSVGVGRAMLAFLLDAYEEDGKRVVLKLHPKLAPYKAAVFPLLANKPELIKKAKGIYDNLKLTIMVAWDDRGNIGGRYASQDEIGTPFCITVDFQSLEDERVTVRDRDTTKQDRVKIVDLKEYLHGKID